MNLFKSYLCILLDGGGGRGWKFHVFGFRNRCTKKAVSGVGGSREQRFESRVLVHMVGWDEIQGL